MIETHLNLFDASVIGVLALSCLFAFFRGFIREVLSLGAWIGAAIITIYYFPEVAEKLKPHFKSAVAAAGIGTLIIYTVALITFSIINSVILKYVRTGNEVGMLDNAMGFLFGLARGALLISLGYFMLSIAMPEKEYPDWLKKSVTRPYAERGAIELTKIAPEYLREISSLEKKAAEQMQDAKSQQEDNDEKDGVKEVKRDHAANITYNPTNKITDKNTGYTKNSSSALDRLINSNNTEQ